MSYSLFYPLPHSVPLPNFTTLLLIIHQDTMKIHQVENTEHWDNDEVDVYIFHVYMAFLLGIKMLLASEK